MQTVSLNPYGAIVWILLIREYVTQETVDIFQALNSLNLLCVWNTLTKEVLISLSAMMEVVETNNMENTYLMSLV